MATIPSVAAIAAALPAAPGMRPCSACDAAGGVAAVAVGWWVVRVLQSEDIAARRRMALRRQPHQRTAADRSALPLLPSGVHRPGPLSTAPCSATSLPEIHAKSRRPGCRGSGCRKNTSAGWNCWPCSPLPVIRLRLFFGDWAARRCSCRRGRAVLTAWLLRHRLAARAAAAAAADQAAHALPAGPADAADGGRAPRSSTP